MKRILIVLLISCSAGISFSQELSENVKRFVDVQGDLVALTNATIIDGTGADAISGMTIIISNSIIRDIYKDESADPPEGADIIECTGKTVIPGLVMLHEHLFYSMPFENHFTVSQMSFTFPRLYLAGGVTTMRTAASIETQSDINIKKWIDEGKITGPKIDVTGPFIERPGMDIPELTFIDNPEQAGEIVDLWAGLGATSFKVYMNITRDDLKEVVARAHKWNYKVTGHICAVTYREAADIGIDNLEHGFMTSTDFIKDKEPDICNSRMIRRSLGSLDRESPEMTDLIQHLIKNNVALTSTLNVFEPYTGREVVPGGGLNALAPQVRERILTGYTRSINRDSASMALFKKEMYWEKKFYDAGGLLVAGTDPTGSGRVVAGYANQHSPELLVESGFSVTEAIKICTLNGAKYLEIDKITGSIQKGKLADLVVIDGDLLDDISNIRKMELVFKEGVGYNSARLFKSVEGQVGLN
jgi:imidazolonepropionase-like amidohydrolase